MTSEKKGQLVRSPLLSVLFRFLLSVYIRGQSEGFVFHVKQMLRELMKQTLALFINSNRRESK